jgi:hypothetical protein
MIKAEDEARVPEAARRFHEEFGTTVAEEIGTEALPLIELRQRGPMVLYHWPPFLPFFGGYPQ